MRVTTLFAGMAPHGTKVIGEALWGDDWNGGVEVVTEAREPEVVDDEVFEVRDPGFLPRPST